MSRSSTVGSFSSTVDSFVASSEDCYTPKDDKDVKDTEASLFGRVREMNATRRVLNEEKLNRVDVLEPKTFRGEPETERSSSQSYIHDLVIELSRKLEVEQQARVESEERMYQHLAADEQARREFERRLGQQFEGLSQQIKQMVKHQRLVMEMFRKRDVTAKQPTPRAIHYSKPSNLRQFQWLHMLNVFGGCSKTDTVNSVARHSASVVVNRRNNRRRDENFSFVV